MVDDEVASQIEVHISWIIGFIGQNLAKSPDETKAFALGVVTAYNSDKPQNLYRVSKYH